jgi:hypothetical protein
MAVFSVVYWTTLPLERRATSRIVDAAFEAANDARRVSSAMPSWGSSGIAGLSGNRFRLKKSDEIVVVFPVSGAGASATFLAVYAPGSGIQTVLPLDPDSASVVDRLPVGLLAAHLSRIGSSEAAASPRGRK